MPATRPQLAAVLAAVMSVLLLGAHPTLGAALDQGEPTTLPPSSTDSATNLTESCQAEQSRCETDLALQAGRVGPGPVSGGRPGRPVCGSDNTTYDNDCHLKRVQCEGRSVEKSHPGKCKGESTTRTHSGIQDQHGRSQPAVALRLGRPASWPQEFGALRGLGTILWVVCHSATPHMLGVASMKPPSSYFTRGGPFPDVLRPATSVTDCRTRWRVGWARAGCRWA
ncbi:uncharacterized protein LOC127750191 [Frankliniella occidentalis]|uniref:Uncharacterized protein LOC127750191 n=1 Tax=Frankliniella occidentalis TaxID=133901 RepID=A0A9C6UBV3_FRAOC|nr:uncharacterized protein LOC127750191 [Frankliniella occidentalis]